MKLGMLGVICVMSGLVFTVVISFIQEWVNATIPPTDCVIGKLGLYTSTFDPTCVLGEPTVPSTVKDRYSRFSPAEYSTTEFWPLFPSQTGFGGAFGEIEFESCEAFYADNSPALATVRDYIADVVDQRIGDAYPRVDSGLNASYSSLTGQIGLAFAKVDEAVVNLWKGEVEKGLLRLFGSVQETLNQDTTGVIDGFAGLETLITTVLRAIPGILGGSTDTTLSYTNVRPAALQGGSSGNWDNICTCGGFGGSPVDLVPNVVTDVPENFISVMGMYANINIPVAAPLVATSKCEEAGAPDQAACEAQVEPVVVAAFTKLKAIATQINARNLCFQDPDMATCLFGGISTMNVSDVSTVMNFNFISSEFKEFLDITVDITEETDEKYNDLLSAQSLLNLCNSNGFQTGAACADNLFAGLPSNFSAPWALCSFAATSEEINKDGLLQPGCSAIDIIKVLGNSPTLLDQIPVELQPAVPALLVAFENCADAGLSVSECKDFLDGTTFANQGVKQNGIPDDFSSPFALCLGVKIAAGPEIPCSTFYDFVNLASRSEEQAALKEFFEGVVSPCTNGGAGTKAGCPEFLKDYNYETTLGALIDGANNKERTIECLNDETDKSRIATAQILVPISIVCQALSLIFVLAAVKNQYQTKKLLRASGVFALIGAITVLTGLLLVKTAPVYASVGQPCPDFEPCYEAGLASTLAYICIAGPLFGGILLLIAAKRAKRVDPESSKISAYETPDF